MDEKRPRGAEKSSGARLIGSVLVNPFLNRFTGIAGTPAGAVSVRRVSGTPGGGRPPVARHVEERVTAILRRQVPPRDEPPRSWIGGLPMMPASIEWPRAPDWEYPAVGESPLNFLAQIACADLPPQLWGGLGPRRGWLLFFAASWGCIASRNPRSMRVFHIDDLGPERQPPADKRPFSDPAYESYVVPRPNYDRWPVDIMAWPIDAEGLAEASTQRQSPIPPDFARLIYPSAEISDEFWRPAGGPFTWGELVMIADLMAISRPIMRRHCEPVERLLLSERDSAIEWIRCQEAEVLARVPGLVDGQVPTGGNKWLERVRRMRLYLESAGDPFDPEELATRIEHSRAGMERWVEARLDSLAGLTDEARNHPPDEWIAHDDRRRINNLLQEEHEYWLMEKQYEGSSFIITPSPRDISLRSLLQKRDEVATATALRELYRKGSRTRATLPENARYEIESRLRSIEDNRPHRLGGVHDDLQGSCQPEGKVLLLQLGCDIASGFNWGDAGGLFCWIDAGALERGDFSDVEWWTENG